MGLFILPLSPNHHTTTAQGSLGVVRRHPIPKLRFLRQPMPPQTQLCRSWKPVDSSRDHHHWLAGPYRRRNLLRDLGLDQYTVVAIGQISTPPPPPTPRQPLDQHTVVAIGQISTPPPPPTPRQPLDQHTVVAIGQISTPPPTPRQPLDQHTVVAIGQISTPPQNPANLCLPRK